MTNHRETEPGRETLFEFIRRAFQQEAAPKPRPCGRPPGQGGKPDRGRPEDTGPAGDSDRK